MNAPTETVLVTSGTGTPGRLVVPRLREAGRRMRALSRRSRTDEAGVEFVTGDPATGQGIEVAAEGTPIIVHCAGTARGDERIPVVSTADRVLFGYLASKLATERVIVGSRLAWTTLRLPSSTSWSWAVARRLARLPVIPVPAGLRFQPVDTGEVATRLAASALGAAAHAVRARANLAPDRAVGQRTWEEFLVDRAGQS